MTAPTEHMAAINADQIKPIKPDIKVIILIHFPMILIVVLILLN